MLGGGSEGREWERKKRDGRGYFNQIKLYLHNPLKGSGGRVREGGGGGGRTGGGGTTSVQVGAELGVLAWEAFRLRGMFRRVLGVSYLEDVV